MDETSLTDFLDEAAEREETATMNAGDADAAISTYGWTPDGTACESCGETVNRRWRDERQFVCADCKPW
jgi:formamidopyrimidine-DNA glycosylase